MGESTDATAASYTQAGPPTLSSSALPSTTESFLPTIRFFTTRASLSSEASYCGLGKRSCIHDDDGDEGGNDDVSDGDVGESRGANESPSKLCESNENETDDRLRPFSSGERGWKRSCEVRTTSSTILAKSLME